MSVHALNISLKIATYAKSESVIHATEEYGPSGKVVYDKLIAVCGLAEINEVAALRLRLLLRGYVLSLKLLPLPDNSEKKRKEKKRKGKKRKGNERNEKERKGKERKEKERKEKKRKGRE
ncbi:hypothetical protein AC249_AIPGENE1954 [Exaiptasia diaphana]|nr:hypothetical protein AC249_AIPGENE1954 [Exaiptasia diaphana]